MLASGWCVVRIINDRDGQGIYLRRFILGNRLEGVGSREGEVIIDKRAIPGIFIRANRIAPPGSAT